jgi:hypothetical protein
MLLARGLFLRALPAWIILLLLVVEEAVVVTAAAAEQVDLEPVLLFRFLLDKVLLSQSALVEPVALDTFREMVLLEATRRLVHLLLLVAVLAVAIKEALLELVETVALAVVVVVKQLAVVALEQLVKEAMEAVQITQLPQAVVGAEEQVL